MIRQFIELYIRAVARRFRIEIAVREITAINSLVGTLPVSKDYVVEIWNDEMHNLQSASERIWTNSSQEGLPRLFAPKS
jgi:hypothetical protein